MSQTVELKVGMSCQGCVGAVKRVLGKMEGVESFDIDIEKQKVTVNGNVEKEAVLQTVSKTGKKTEFWPEEAAEPEAKPTEASAPVPEVKPTEASAPVPEVKPTEASAPVPEVKPTEAPAPEPESKPTEAVVTA